jgi:hypothetical protein
VKLVGLLVMVALAAACGGSSGPTRAGWIKAADAICAKYGPKVAALGPTPSSPPSAVAQHLRASLALTAPELRAVEALPRPGGADGTAIAATLAARDRAVAALKAAASAAERGEDAGAALAVARGYVKAARQAAVALGMHVCGTPAPASAGSPS